MYISQIHFCGDRKEILLYNTNKDTKKTDILLFYMNKDGINNILGYSDMYLEYKHDIIQWLFPLDTPSLYNSSAPVLTEEDIKYIRSNNEIKENIVRVFTRIMLFYGYRLENNTLVEIENSKKRFESWITPYNHNYLRLTRVLKSLNILGLESYSDMLFRALETVYIENSDVISLETFSYWLEASKYNKYEHL